MKIIFLWLDVKASSQLNDIHIWDLSLVNDIYYRGDTESFQPWIKSINLSFSLLLNLCIVTFPNSTFRWLCMVIILIIKPTTCTNFSNLFFIIELYTFRTVPLYIIRSFSLYKQQYIRVCWQLAISRIRTERPDFARKLSANLYNIYHCCVYSEKILMMDIRTVRNLPSFIPKINLRN